LKYAKAYFSQEPPAAGRSLGFGYEKCVRDLRTESNVGQLMILCTAGNSRLLASPRGTGGTDEYLGRVQECDSALASRRSCGRVPG